MEQFYHIICNEIVRYLLPKDQNALCQVNKILYCKLKDIPTMWMIKQKGVVLKELMSMMRSVHYQLNSSVLIKRWKLHRLVKFGKVYDEYDPDLDTSISWQAYQLNNGKRLSLNYSDDEKSPQQLWMYLFTRI